MLIIKKQNKSNFGFTMIELLAVVTIMAILFTIGIVSYTNASRNARNNRRRTDIVNIRQALVLFRSDNGCYPASDQWPVLGTVLLNGGYWSEQDFPTDVGYNYNPSGNCGAGMAATFTLSAILENEPDFIVGSP